MEELLSYRLSDLLLFSEHTYARLFERYNHWLFPFQYLAYLHGLAFLPAWLERRPGLIRALLLATALLWLVCIYYFMFQLYTQISWMISYLLPLLMLQAVLLLWAGLSLPPAAERSSATLVLWVSALLLPTVELSTGRPAEALSAYALTPDSLAICSIALMLTLRRPVWLFVPSAAWLIFSALTHIAMENPTSWYLLGVLVLAAITPHLNKRRSARNVTPGNEH